MFSACSWVSGRKKLMKRGEPGSPRITCGSLRSDLALVIWVWLKIKDLGLRGFLSLVPFTKVPFWYQFLEPQPYLYFPEASANGSTPLLT